MPSFSGDSGVYVEEGCLDKELVGIARQCNDLFDIPLIVGEINNVSDFLSACCAQGMFFQFTQRYGEAIANTNFGIVWRALPHRTFGLTKPRPNRKSKPPQPLSSHIDAQL